MWASGLGNSAGYAPYLIMRTLTGGTFRSIFWSCLTPLEQLSNAKLEFLRAETGYLAKFRCD